MATNFCHSSIWEMQLISLKPWLALWFLTSSRVAAVTLCNCRGWAKNPQLQPLAFGMLPLGNCLQWRRPRFDPWVGKIPWRRKGQPTPVFLPGEFHRQRSLVGYSPRDQRVRRDCATNSIFKPFPHSGQHHGKQKNNDLKYLMDYSPPGSSVHGILQARILE